MSNKVRKIVIYTVLAHLLNLHLYDGVWSIAESPLLNECEQNNVTCGSGKVCVDHVGNYSCECPEGKIGGHCEQGMHMTTNMLFQIWDLTTVLSWPLLNPIGTSPLFILWANGFTTFSLYVILF